MSWAGYNFYIEPAYSSIDFIPGQRYGYNFPPSLTFSFLSSIFFLLNLNNFKTILLLVCVIVYMVYDLYNLRWEEKRKEEVYWKSSGVKDRPKLTRNHVLNKLRTVFVYIYIYSLVYVYIYSLLQYLLFSSALSKKGAISIHAMAPNFLQAFPQTHVLVIHSFIYYCIYSINMEHRGGM